MPKPKKGADPRLVFRVRPVKGESARGWTLRVAEANGYPGTRFLDGLLMALYPERPKTNKAAGLLHLLEMSGCEPADLSMLGSVGDGYRSYVTDPSQQFSQHLLDGSFSKFCPRCLAAQPVFLSAWELDLWCGCPVHGCAMVDQCHNCNRRLAWNRPFLSRCCESCPFADAPVENLDAGSLDLVRLFALRLGIHAPLPSENLERLTSGIGWAELFRLTKFLGLTWKLGRVPPARHLKRLHALIPVTEAHVVAASMLSDWPAGLHRLIDRVVRSHGKPVSNFSGPLHAFGLNQTGKFCGTQSDLVQDAARTYLRKTYSF